MDSGRLWPSTTSHKHEPIDLTLEVFARLGMRDLDLNLWHSIESAVPAAHIARTAERLGQRIRIASGGWCDFFHDAPEIHETFQSVDRQVACLRDLGVGTLRLFFGRLPRAEWSDHARTRARDHLRRLSDAYPAVTFLMENHGNGAAGCPDVCHAILAAVDRPNVRATFDPINFEFAGFDHLTAWRLLRPFVGHIHVKGIVRPPDSADRAAFEYCEFGAGDVDLQPFLREVAASGYPHAFTVEYEGHADRTLRLYGGWRRAEAAWREIEQARATATRTAGAAGL